MGHTLYHNITQDQKRRFNDLEGAIRASYEGERHSFRGEFIYQKNRPHLQGVSGNAQWEYRPQETSALQLNLTRLIHERETLSQLSFFKMQGRISYGLTLSHRSHVGLSASLNLHASFGRDPRSRRWTLQGASAASQGAVSAIAYLDENNNQKRDRDEAILENAAFEANGTLRPNLLSKKAIHFITHIGRYNHAKIGLNTQSLEDPYLRPSIESYRFLPRSGRVVTLDFPMVAYAEVTGTVRIDRDGELKELQGVDIVLRNADGKIAYQARSAYDGFFCFNEVQKGSYQLDISDEIKAKGYQCLQTPKIHIQQSGEPLDGCDLLLGVQK